MTVRAKAMGESTVLTPATAPASRVLPMHDGRVELVGTLIGIDGAAPGVEQRRVFHHLNNSDHHIEAGSALAQLFIAAGNRII